MRDELLTLLEVALDLEAGARCALPPSQPASSLSLRGQFSEWLWILRRGRAALCSFRDLKILSASVAD